MTSASVPVHHGSALHKRDLSEIFFRSVFFQTLWNFQRMQNLGWLFSFWPVLRRLYKDPAARGAAAAEHLEYFNTHPSMVNLLLGVVAGLEEDHAVGGHVRRDQILAARKLMSGPMAALGETLFGASTRPLFAVLSLSLGWIFVWDSWWAVPLIFLGLTNAVHLVVRWGGLAAGYRWKTQVVAFLMRLNLQRVAHGASLLGVGICTGAIATLWGAFGDGRAAAAGMVVGALLALRLGLSSTKLFYATIIVCIGLEYMS